MTTKRQIKKLLQPVLDLHDDLELVGQWLHVRPVKHVARAVLIDRTASADQFQVRWAAINLCEPRESFPLNWGNYVWPRKRRWQWTDPDMPAALYKKLEPEALSPLRRLDTLQQFNIFASTPENFETGVATFQHWPLKKITIESALGNFGAALKECVELTTTRNKWQHPMWREEYDRVVKQLYPLLQAGDRTGIAKLLHEWEAFTAENFGINHIWEKTPFPFEEK